MFRTHSDSADSVKQLTSIYGKARIKIPSEYLNAGKLLVCIVQFSTLRIGKMKKLLKIMIPMMMIKLVGLRSKSGSLGNKSRD